MKQFLEILTNVRIGAAEVGGTLGLLFLISYGAYMAYQEFIAKPFKKAVRRTPRQSRVPRDVKGDVVLASPPFLPATRAQSSRERGTASRARA